MLTKNKLSQKKNECSGNLYCMFIYSIKSCKQDSVYNYIVLYNKVLYHVLNKLYLNKYNYLYTIYYLETDLKEINYIVFLVAEDISWNLIQTISFLKILLRLYIKSNSLTELNY